MREAIEATEDSKKILEISQSLLTCPTCDGTSCGGSCSFTKSLLNTGALGSSQCAHADTAAGPCVAVRPAQRQRLPAGCGTVGTSGPMRAVVPGAMPDPCMLGRSPRQRAWLSRCWRSRCLGEPHARNTADTWNPTLTWSECRRDPDANPISWSTPPRRPGWVDLTSAVEGTAAGANAPH